MVADAPALPLRGISIVSTRERRGLLDSALAARGADVVHVPLIETVDPDDGGAELRATLADIERYDWVIVTSPVGAERVMPAVRGSAARVAVVVTRTGEVAAALIGRPADVIPTRQLGAALVEAMPPPDAARRVLLAVADRADPATPAALAARGYDVTSVVAYRTLLRTPTWRQRRAAMAADVVAFASGSAVTAWHAAIGSVTPRWAVSIGPSTSAVAAELGLQIDATATDYSIDGLVAAIVRTAAGAS